MKISKIAKAVGRIDDDLVTAASEKPKKSSQNMFLKYSLTAACFVIAVIAAIIVIPSFRNSNIPNSGKYINYKIPSAELGIVWPWEYMAVFEQYTTIKIESKEYTARSESIDEKLLGDVIGTYEAEGYDRYTGKKYTRDFEVRRIGRISEERLVAVNMYGKFYVYIRNDNNMPSTFGELSEIYRLSDNLKFSRFTKCESSGENRHYIVNDDKYIWQILSECQNAAICKDNGWFLSNKNYLSFAITSEALGVYKRVFNVTEDGYIWTNIFDFCYIYNIGEDAAKKIIRYAESNADEAPFDPYEYTIVGTLTEIGDGYMLVDDTVICNNKSDGTVFRISADDIRIKRCIEYTNIKVGDIVAVTYRGTVSANNEIDKAFSVYSCNLFHGSAIIAE